MTPARLIELEDAAPAAALRTFANAEKAGQVANYLTAIHDLRRDGLTLADDPEAAHDLTTPHLWLARLISLSVQAHEANGIMWLAWRKERRIWGVGGFVVGVLLSALIGLLIYIIQR